VSDSENNDSWFDAVAAVVIVAVFVTVSLLWISGQ